MAMTHIFNSKYYKGSVQLTSPYAAPFLASLVTVKNKRGKVIGHQNNLGQWVDKVGGKNESRWARGTSETNNRSSDSLPIR